MLLVSTELLHQAQLAIQQGLEVHNFVFLVFSSTLASHHDVEMSLAGERFHTLRV